jgi:hypothetical protein
LSGFSRDGGEEVSQPIEHSPGPWYEAQYNYDLDHWQRGVAWCIRDADGRTVIDCNPHSGEPLDDNGKLLAAAPTMYRIIRQICSTDWEEREQGLRSAQFLLQELEGRE